MYNISVGEVDICEMWHVEIITHLCKADITADKLQTLIRVTLQPYEDEYDVIKTDDGLRILRTKVALDMRKGFKPVMADIYKINELGRIPCTNGNL